LKRIHKAFLSFHAAFAPAFGRKQWRERSRDYLQALLVQAEQRCNAENLAEVVPASARVLQRFLTDARWDDARVIARLHDYLGPRLSHPEAVWAIDTCGFAKQGRKSVGVARQYCGSLGRASNCQIGIFLAHAGPRGRLLVDKQLYLPEEWTDDPERCQAAGVPEAACAYRTKADLALKMLCRARSLGHLAAEWVTGSDVEWVAPAFRDQVAAAGWQYVLEVPGNRPVWSGAPARAAETAAASDRFSPARQVAAQQTVRERAAALPKNAWGTAEGVQGTGGVWFARERVRESRNGKPGQPTWLLHRRSLDAGELRHYLAHAPEETPLATLARASMAYEPIQPDPAVDPSCVGLHEYEVRTWLGWHHHITMSLLASAFLFTLRQKWGGQGVAGDASGHLKWARAMAAAALDPRRWAIVSAAEPWDTVSPRSAEGTARPGSSLRQ